MAGSEEDPRSPEPALVGQVRRVTSRPLRVMLRLREGFGTDGGELVRLQGLVTAYRQVGADGLVLGFLNAHTEVDVAVVTALVGDGDFGWTFSRAVDSCISVDRAWRELRRLPGLDAVLTAGSPRGVTEGLDDLVARAEHRPLRPVGDHGRRRAAARARALAGPRRRTRLPGRRGGAAARLDQGVRRRRPGPDLAPAGRRRDATRAGPGVTVYIDPPTWPGHGRLWSHLVSDTSYEELHAFAAGLGIPRRAFERDHYDVIDERYAERRRRRRPTGRAAAKIVARLHAAGLRRRKVSRLARWRPGRREGLTGRGRLSPCPPAPTWTTPR